VYRPITLVSCLALASLLGVAQAEPCQRWGEARVVGVLDSGRLDEVSGIAASRQHPGRLYHSNDSVFDSHFYITDLQGNVVVTVPIQGSNFANANVEDLSMGTCLDGQQCLFIADIGDNQDSRKGIEILVIKEQPEFPQPVTPALRLKLTYPDRPQNAEAFAVHPNGDIFILTKALYDIWSPGFWDRTMEKWFGKDHEMGALPARLYKLERQQWQGNPTTQHELEFVGQIDLPALIGHRTQWPYALVATGLSIAPDGKRFLILTYSFVLEFHLDLSQTPLPATADLVKNRDYRFITIKGLPYQEAITYLPDGRSFMYHTEKYKDAPQEMVRVDCAE